MKESLFMTVMAKILFGQIGTQENQMIGEKEKIVSEAMTVVQENTNGMMTSVIRNIQSYVKSQVYQLINFKYNHQGWQTGAI